MLFKVKYFVDFYCWHVSGVYTKLNESNNTNYLIITKKMVHEPNSERKLVVLVQTFFIFSNGVSVNDMIVFCFIKRTSDMIVMALDFNNSNLSANI